MTNYIPPGCIGARIESMDVYVGSAGFCVGSAKDFGCQRVGIGNAICSRWGSRILVEYRLYLHMTLARVSYFLTLKALINAFNLHWPVWFSI